MGSCQKEPDLIGLGLVPGNDLMQHEYIDTTTVIAYTVREDSVRTNELSANLLGSVADPVFGTTTASIYTQFRLPNVNTSFGTSPVVDSIILTLTYSGIYGDSLAQKNIQVYELAGDLSKDASYYSTSTVRINPTIIGQASFVPSFLQPDSIDGEYIAPHMRINLTPAFANKLITASSTTLSSNDSFQKEFKGFYITSSNATNPGTGSILYLNLTGSMSKVTVHYHNSTDTATLNFPINSSTNSYCARFNHYNHFGYQGADPALISQFKGDTTSGNNELFVEAMGGAKIRVRFPYLTALAKQKKIAINEAVLVLENMDPDEDYPMPSLLGIRALTSDTLTHYSTLPDEDEGSAFINGYSIDNKQYRIRITRYVQNRLLHPDDPDYGLMLIAAGGALIGNRAVLKGPGATSGRMRLLIYYTLLD